MSLRPVRPALALALVLAVAACSDTATVPASQLNLDRPVDIAFACYGGLRITNGAPATIDQEVTLSARSRSRRCDSARSPRGRPTRRRCRPGRRA